MYQISEESLNNIRIDALSRMKHWELDLISERNSINEFDQKHTLVQGEAGFIELLVRLKSKPENGCL